MMDLIKFFVLVWVVLTAALLWIYGAWVGVPLTWVTLAVARRQHPWMRLGWQYLTFKRGAGAAVGFGFVTAVVGYTAIYFADCLGLAASGVMEALGGAAVAAAILITSLAVLASMARRTPMPSIFTLVSDKQALAEFVGDTKAQAGQRPALQEIDPVKLAALVRSQVIGQDAIVTDICQQLARRIRLSRPKRPLGVFLLVGATGAGKTELAKALAKFAFEGRLSRVDCNELTAEHSAQRLIGAPPGYVGSEQGGQLTRDIMRMGSGVILFDEIEKAHEAVLRLIMGLLDEGRITEASTGNVADASQCLIVMTSNAEHAALAEIATTITDADERRRAVKDTLTGVFKPEQLARIDDIHCFAPLDRSAMIEVVGKFLFGFARDTGVELVAVDSGILIETVLRHEKGAKYGIRELIRLVERAIVDGMLDRRADGFKRVAIRCADDKVEIVGVPNGRDAAQFVANLQQQKASL